MSPRVLTLTLQGRAVTSFPRLGVGDNWGPLSAALLPTQGL